MRLSRPRFSIRVLLLVVLVTALNLGAGIAAWRSYVTWADLLGARDVTEPRGGVDPECSYWSVESDGAGGHKRVQRGRVCFGLEPQGLILRQVSSDRRSLIPRLAWPAAGVSASFLVILFPMMRIPWRPSPRAKSAAGKSDGAGSPIRPTGPRLVLLAAALLSLNLAVWNLDTTTPFVIKVALNEKSALPGESTYEELFGGRPVTLILRMHGRNTARRRVDGCDVPGLPRRLAWGETAKYRWYHFSMDEATIEFESDDSIVTYGGTHDHKLSDPRVLRPAIRTPLDLWWPRIAATATTMLVIGYLGKTAIREAGKVPRPVLDQEGY